MIMNGEISSNMCWDLPKEWTSQIVSIVTCSICHNIGSLPSSSIIPHILVSVYSDVSLVFVFMFIFRVAPCPLFAKSMFQCPYIPNLLQLSFCHFTQYNHHADCSLYVLVLDPVFAYHSPQIRLNINFVFTSNHISAPSLLS